MRAIVLAGIAALAIAVPAPATELNDVRQQNLDMATTLGWTRSGLCASEMATMYVALSHSEETRAQLLATLEEVSQPESPRYGRYLSRAALREMATPLPSAEIAVHTWLATHGLTGKQFGTGDFVKVVAPCATLSAAFHVELAYFRHAKAQRPIIRTLDVLDVPASLVGLVDFVGGVSSFPDLHRASPAVSAGPTVTPPLLKKLYSITDVASPNSKASQAVAEFQMQTYLPSDLTAFESMYSLPAQNVRIGTGPDGFNSSAQVESSLDVQYIIATGTGVPTDFWLEPASSNFDLLGWAGYVLNTSTVQNQVWSVSYGEGVNGGIGGVIPPAFALRLDAEFVKFGLLGHSVLVATGDNGVWNRDPLEKFKFHPFFPAVCPHVTAVGATQLEADGSETTAVSFTGGGFSPRNYFPRASTAAYQSTAVNRYLTSKVALPNATYWDSTGRAIPDISAVGVDFNVIISGVPNGVSGTSCSTPTVAGIIALINDKRLAAGQASMGFLNPFLYGASANCFRDILKGLNNNGDIFQPAFYAWQGWDPVSGMGTPNYANLKAAALAAGAKTSTQVVSQL